MLSPRCHIFSRECSSGHADLNGPNREVVTNADPRVFTCLFVFVCLKTVQHNMCLVLLFLKFCLLVFLQNSTYTKLNEMANNVAYFSPVPEN